MNLSGQLRELIRQTLAKLNFPDIPVVLNIPPDQEKLGDRSTPVALALAKKVGGNPWNIAQTLAKNFPWDKHFISQLDTKEPGYLCFYWSDQTMAQLIESINHLKDQYGDLDSGVGEKRLFEFVSANPTGPMNIVSARAAALGDSLVKLQRKIGFEADSEFYVNDSGRQVRLLGESVQARLKELQGQPLGIPEGGYHGTYVKNIAVQAQEHFGNSVADIPSEELGKWAASQIVGQQRETLTLYGVEFQRWFFESELYADECHVKVLEILGDNNHIYEQDGATYFRSSSFGDDEDRVVVTSDGRPTYFLPDMGYHLNKAARGYKKAIDLLGPDHHGHGKRMQAAMRALGLAEDFLEILIVQQVNLKRGGKPVKMSKRTGEIITMGELLEEVGADAARQIFLSRKWSTHLDFDIEVAKDRSEKSPVFYVQYAHARICSIFKKAGEHKVTQFEDLQQLTAIEERNLMRALALFPDVVEGAALQYAPHRLNAYLGELATAFHHFYHECRVISDDESLTRARLALCSATQIVLKEGLRLLGMSAPERM